MNEPRLFSWKSLFKLLSIFFWLEVGLFFTYLGTGWYCPLLNIPASIILFFVRLFGHA